VAGSVRVGHPVGGNSLDAETAKEMKMGNFHEVEFSGLSIANCDEIALKNAGVLSDAFGYGYALPRGGPVNSEYDSVVINTQGMGNHGSIILRGRTPRTRQLIREGKVLHLTRHGIPWVVARVAPSCQYGMELDVVELADDLMEAVRLRGQFRGRSHRAFSEWAGSWTENLEMSFPRKDAAAEIAKIAVWRSGCKDLLG
jgi:hypothetical protein